MKPTSNRWRQSCSNLHRSVQRHRKPSNQPSAKSILKYVCCRITNVGPKTLSFHWNRTSNCCSNQRQVGKDFGCSDSWRCWDKAAQTEQKQNQKIREAEAVKLQTLWKLPRVAKLVNHCCCWMETTGWLEGEKVKAECVTCKGNRECLSLSAVTIKAFLINTVCKYLITQSQNKS